jgi:hypothetical protein
MLANCGAQTIRQRIAEMGAAELPSDVGINLAVGFGAEADPLHCTATMLQCGSPPPA